MLCRGSLRAGRWRVIIPRSGAANVFSLLGDVIFLSLGLMCCILLPGVSLRSLVSAFGGSTGFKSAPRMFSVFWCYSPGLHTPGASL